jgi:hypothetical protein
MNQRSRAKSYKCYFCCGRAQVFSGDEQNVGASAGLSASLSGGGYAALTVVMSGGQQDVLARWCRLPCRRRRPPGIKDAGYLAVPKGSKIK